MPRMIRTNRFPRKVMNILFLPVVLLAVTGVMPLSVPMAPPPSPSGRVGEVILNSMNIDANWTLNESMDTVYATGRWKVTVDFNLTRMVTGVNVTVNVTEDGSAYSQIYTEEMGDILGGNHVVETPPINFTNETLYTVNATITNWNGSIEESFEIELAFELVYEVFVFAGLAEEPAESGEYANETHIVRAVFYNLGNDALPNYTNLNITITDHRGAVVVEHSDGIGPIPYDDLGFALFEWTPARENGYYLNVSYHNPDIHGGAVQYHGDNNVTLVIEDVLSYDAWVGVVDPEIDEGDFMEASIIVNNTGNVQYDFLYTVNLSRDGWSFEEPRSTGALDPFEFDETEQGFVYCMEDEGTYTLAVTFDLDGMRMLDSFDVLGINAPPRLEDETLLPKTIFGGDVVNFTVNYTDEDNNTPDFVRFHLGREWNEENRSFDQRMLDLSMRALDTEDIDYSDGKLYRCNWTTEEGMDYQYAFSTSDGELEEHFRSSQMKFEVFVPNPATGRICGRVLGEHGYGGTPVPGASVIIFREEELIGRDDTDHGKMKRTATVKVYFNTTTDDAGNYTKVLEYGAYSIYVNATGFFNSSEESVTLTAGNIQRNVDFSLRPWEPSIDPPTEGIVSGRVTTFESGVAKGVGGACVCIYEDPRRGNPDGGKATRQFPLVAEAYTNEDGYYTCTLPLGSYLLNAISEGFEESWLEAFELSDADPDAVIDVNLYFEHQEYELSGSISPTYARMYVDGDPVEVTYGRYSLMLEPGEHSLRAEYSGYKTYEAVINLSRDTVLNVELEREDQYRVLMGPFTDSDGNLLEGVMVTIVTGNTTWVATTDELGLAVLQDFPYPSLSHLPEDSTVEARYDGHTIDPLGDDYSFPIDPPPEKETRSYGWIWMIIFFAIFLVVGGIAAVYFLLIRKASSSSDLDDMGPIEESHGDGERHTGRIEMAPGTVFRTRAYRRRKTRPATGKFADEGLPDERPRDEQQDRSNW